LASVPAASPVVGTFPNSMRSGKVSRRLQHASKKWGDLRVFART
jgi:hypothetical protein